MMTMTWRVPLGIVIRIPTSHPGGPGSFGKSNFSLDLIVKNKYLKSLLLMYKKYFMKNLNRIIKLQLPSI